MPLTEDEFSAIVADISRRLDATAPGWTDHSNHDPGLTLLQVFAFLAESLTYRAGQLPSSAHVAIQRTIRELEALKLAGSADDSLTRNRYFAGKLLGVDDFQVEQDYLRSKHRRHNLHMHGVGVVDGLDVTVGRDGSTSDKWVVSIQPGCAIAPDGEELLLTILRRCEIDGHVPAGFVSIRYGETPSARTAPSDEPSRIVEAVVVSIDETPPAGALALARLQFAGDVWTIDSRYRPPVVR